MSRNALVLASLADAAVPGVRPSRVEEVVEHVGDRFRVGFVEAGDERRWVVRLPADAVAAAQQDETVALLELLGPRLPFAVPQPAGFVSLKDGRRAMVYPLVPGRILRFAFLPAGSGLAEDLGRCLAAVHDVDRGLFEEAGVPSYDAEDCRIRRQVDVDRGAQTGLVPTGLLARWERMLDDVSWWRFAPAPVHGRLDETHVLCVFDDEEDAAGGRVAGIMSWEAAQIGDPAEDLAAVLGDASPEAARTVVDAYERARHEPPDRHLADRARLLRELRLLSDLLTARSLGDRRHVSQATEALRRLDDAVSEVGASGNRSGTSVDRLPVDFSHAAPEEDFYRAGTPHRDDRLVTRDEEPGPAGAPAPATGPAREADEAGWPSEERVAPAGAGPGAGDEAGVEAAVSEAGTSPGSPVPLDPADAAPPAPRREPRFDDEPEEEETPPRSLRPTPRFDDEPEHDEAPARRVRPEPRFDDEPDVDQAPARPVRPEPRFDDELDDDQAPPRPIRPAPRFDDEPEYDDAPPPPVRPAPRFDDDPDVDQAPPRAARRPEPTFDDEPEFDEASGPVAPRPGAPRAARPGSRDAGAPESADARRGRRGDEPPGR